MTVLGEMTQEQLLAAFGQAANDEQADEILSALMERHASEQVHKYFFLRVDTDGNGTGLKFSRADAEDLASVATIGLITSLRSYRQMPSESGIRDLDAYIRGICNAVYSDHFRKRFTEYSKLKNRIWYLLSKRDPVIVTDRRDRRSITCALREHSTRRSPLTLDDIVDSVSAKIPGHTIADEEILVTEALEQARGTLLVNDLIKAIARLRGIETIPPNEVVVDGEIIDGLGHDGDADRHERVHKLANLWNEIRLLPRLQRLSLLYHLRDADGREVNTVWFESGVATLAEIAAEFEIAEADMANLLVRLPLSDAQIAAELRVDPDADGGNGPWTKKISNLRQVARAALQRRLDGKQKRTRAEK